MKKKRLYYYYSTSPDKGLRATPCGESFQAAASAAFFCVVLWDFLCSSPPNWTTCQPSENLL